MELKNHVEYLSGQKFSAGLKIHICNFESSIIYRLNYLVLLSSGKKVIHVGCVDHLEEIENKRKKNIWLHGLLVKATKRCVGIDINDKGINYVKKLGYSDLYSLDIIKNDVPEEIKNDHFEYMLLGEILEHVDNPVLFLSEIHKKYKEYVDQIVITVPNAFNYQNIIGTLKKQEIINSDHRYWFTPFTLAKVACSSGFRCSRYFFVHHQKLSMLALIKNIIFRLFPSTRSTLLMILDF